MAKRLAIEWDARELRIAAGTVRGNVVTISDVASTPIESSDPAVLGEKLRELLAQHGLEKSSAAIALGRGKAELRELKLPPVPEEELPDMVRFQAVRTFAGAGERAVIDFLPTRRDEEGSRVIAAAVAPEELKNCALVGAPSQLVVEHIVLGPLAAAALYRRSGRDLTGETVLIDLLADDADIVVLRDGNLAFVRSIRLADDPQVRVRTLSGEVRRSLMACQEGQGATECPRRIVLWGRADVHRDEVAGLNAALGTAVETLDPFSLVAIAPALEGRLPEHVGRLAPLVGLLDAEARGGSDLIDFLNPRRAPEPVSNRGRQLAIAAAVVGLLGMLAFFGWRQMKTLDDQIAIQQTALKDLEDDAKSADEAMARTAKVDAFLDGDVFWLDELRRVATKMPPAENAIAESFSARVGRNGGGTLVITGGVTDSETISRFEAALRDDAHRVVGKGLGLVANKAPYNWEFSETVEIDPAIVRQSREAIAAGPPPSSTSESESETESEVDADSETERDAQASSSDVESTSDVKSPSDAAAAANIDAGVVPEADATEVPPESPSNDGAPNDGAPNDGAPNDGAPNDGAAEQDAGVAPARTLQPEDVQ